MLHFVKFYIKNIIMKKEEKRMTLKDIAQKANVSPATVSLVVNNKKGVGMKKRVEIQKLLNDTNYNTQKKTNGDPIGTLLFIKYSSTGKLIEENEGFISVILNELGNECRRLGYQLIYHYCHNYLDESLKNINFANIDGVFLLGTELIPEEYSFVNLIPKPLVVIDNYIPGYQCNSITMNNEEMVGQSFDFMFSKNPNLEVGYLQGKVFARNFEERLSGLKLACEKVGMSLDQNNIIMMDPTVRGSYKDMLLYLKENNSLPKVLFADNDTIAIGSIQAILEFGLKIPEDIEIVGFDDIVFSRNITPSLTTMRVNRRLIGRAAVKLMKEAIQSQDFSNVKVKIGGSLIVRNSTKIK